LTALTKTGKGAEPSHAKTGPASVKAASAVASVSAILLKQFSKRSICSPLFILKNKLNFPQVTRPSDTPLFPMQAVFIFEL
jgi:hypothetical protein